MLTTAEQNGAQPLSDEIISGIINLPKPEGCIKKAAYAPTRVLSAIRSAGMKLRFDPYQPVTETPVFLTDEQSHDISNRVLSSIINASHGLFNSGPHVPFSSGDPHTRGICYNTETYFVRSLRSLADNAEVVTDGEKPVILIKEVNERVGLTLCDITIDGIPYPPGSIADISMKTPVEKAHVAVGQEVSTVPRSDIQDVDTLCFLRLSRFALPLSQQSSWDEYKGDFDADKEGPLRLRYVPIRRIVTRVMKALENEQNGMDPQQQFID